MHVPYMEAIKKWRRWLTRELSVCKGEIRTQDEAVSFAKAILKATTSTFPFPTGWAAASKRIALYSIVAFAMGYTRRTALPLRVVSLVREAHPRDSDIDEDIILP